MTVVHVLCVGLNKAYDVVPFCPYGQSEVHMGFMSIIQNNCWLLRRPPAEFDEEFAIGQVVLEHLTVGQSAALLRLPEALLISENDSVLIIKQILQPGEFLYIFIT